MAVLRVIRKSGRLSQVNFGNDMRAIWEDENVLYRMSKAVANYTWNDIVNSFIAVQNMYRNYGVQYHTFQLEITEDIEQDDILGLMANILEYFGRYFQTLITYKMESRLVLLHLIKYLRQQEYQWKILLSQKEIQRKKSRYLCKLSFLFVYYNNGNVPPQLTH